MIDIETGNLPAFIDDPRAALDPAKARIVSIGIKSREEEIVFTHNEECQLLEHFLIWLAETEAIANEFAVAPVLVTGYNIKGFDLPFLEARCVANGLQMSNGFQIDDLMLDLYPKGWPSCESFDKAAARFGIVRQNALRGSDVPRLWQEGKLQDIVAHNLDDIRSEWALWLALKSHGDESRCQKP